MRRHAKASSAGPTQRQANGLGLLVLLIAAFFAIPAAQASASLVTVTLSGPGTGTVTSSPPGIECSNTPGNVKTDCTEEIEGGQVATLIATADSGAIFDHWTGNAIHFPEIGFISTCNSGSENPCSFTVLIGETIDASFALPPDPPVAITGSASELSSQQTSLEGTVNPEGAKVTQCRFEYGPTTEYGESTSCSPADLGTGTADVPVSAKTGALEPETTYHYRLVATNLGGKSEGEDATFTTGAAPADDCPNTAIRVEQGIRALRLPECMAFEMVSPPIKFNQFARKSRTGTADGFSADGNRVVFESIAALGDTSKAGLFDKYMAIRTASGWKTKSLVPPYPYVGGFGSSGLPCTYSPDFSRWTTLAATETGTKLAVATILRSLEGAFSPLSPAIVPTSVPNGGGTSTAVNQSACYGGSADARHMFFAVEGYTYFPGEDFSPASQLRNVLEAYLDEDGIPRFRRPQLDGDGVIVGGSCGARIGGPGGGNTSFTRGAVSPDASRVYFTTRPDQASNSTCDSAKRLRIMKRIETPAGPWISEVVHSECTRVSPPCSTANSDDIYQAASQEGTKLFFKTTRQLADSDLDTGSDCGETLGTVAGCDLYLYDSTRPFGERLIQASAGEATAPTPGEGAEVLGLVEMGGDGSRAYFVARGVLSTVPNEKGDTAVAGQPNLYLYQRDSDFPDGRTVFVGTLSSADQFQLWSRGANGTSATAVPSLGGDIEDQSVGGSGRVLVLLSAASLTADDMDGGKEDFFRFDSDTGEIERVSQAASGGSDNGLFSAKGRGVAGDGPQAFSVDRNTSEDGETIVFSTMEALDPTDVNGQENAYIWQDGEVSALPYATAPTVSMSGEAISFNSFSRLTWEDGDGASDVYAAKIDGGFPIPVPPPPCQGEACQEPFRAQPPVQGGASDSFVGSGNVKEKPKSKRKGKSKKRKKAQRKQRNRAGHKQGGQK